MSYGNQSGLVFLARVVCSYRFVDREVETRVIASLFCEIIYCVTTPARPQNRGDWLILLLKSIFIICSCFILYLVRLLMFCLRSTLGMCTDCDIPVRAYVRSSIPLLRPEASCIGPCWSHDRLLSPCRRLGCGSSQGCYSSGAYVLVVRTRDGPKSHAFLCVCTPCLVLSSSVPGLRIPS